MSASRRRKPALSTPVVVVLTLLLTTLTGSGAALAHLGPVTATGAAGPSSAAPATAPAEPSPTPVEAAATVGPAAPVDAPVGAPTEPPPALGTAVSEAAEPLCELVGDTPLCAHGHSAEQYAATGGGSTPAPVAVGCAGDGRSGNRFQVVYVRASDRPDRYGSVAGAIRQTVDSANGVFVRSSDNRRSLRVVTSSSCVTQVARVTVTPSQARSFDQLLQAVRAAGHARVDRKYLLFVDGDAACGLAQLYLDDGASSYNRNNDGGMTAAMWARCWNGRVVAHEIAHLLGAVQNSAPRSTGRGHCTDGHDLLCYDDGSGRAVTARCGSGWALLLDCGRDDYFSVAPAPGSYLATHWNTAANSFLAGGGAPVPTRPSVPTSVSSSRRGDDVTVRWGAPVQSRSGLTGFDVVDQASGDVVASTSGGARSAVVRLTPWRTYRLAVTAKNAVGASAAVAAGQHMVGRAPAAPLALAAVPLPAMSEVHAQLSWPAVAKATSYRVLRDGRVVATTTRPGWTDTAALSTARVYRYTVVARNVWGTSDESPPSSFVGV